MHIQCVFDCNCILLKINIYLTLILLETECAFIIKSWQMLYPMKFEALNKLSIKKSEHCYEFVMTWVSLLCLPPVSSLCVNSFHTPVSVQVFSSLWLPLPPTELISALEKKKRKKKH